MKTKQNKTKHFFSVFILLFYSVLLNTSCSKEEFNNPTKTTINNKPTKSIQEEEEPIDSSAINEYSAKLTTLYSEIANLEDTSFCNLQLILTNDTLTQEQKFVLIETNSNLASVYDKLLFVNGFRLVNTTLMSQIHTDQSTLEKEYFIEQFTHDLGIDVDIPNDDPCNPYWAARKSCSYNYVAACLIALEAGPVSPFAWLILTGLYIDCLQTADANNPSCVGTGISSTISQIAEKQSICN